MRTVTRHLTLIGFCALSVVLAAWTAFTLSDGPLTALDRALPSPRIDPTSAAGQILATVAMVTWPGVTYAVVAGLAIWAYTRRLRNLALALWAVIPLAWLSSFALKSIVQRERQPSAFHVITTSGWSYPSGHMTAITVLVVALIAITTTQRQSPRTILTVRAIGGLLMAVVALDRWAMGAHYVTDLVAGVLLGGAAATAALVLTRVQTMPQSLGLPSRSAPPVDRTAAVIFNPTKITDYPTFRRRVDFEARTRGWNHSIWLETDPDDSGRGAARTALAREVDLVLIAGGDGTVRVVCSELAYAGIPVALIPAGTGNLLARNLNIPFDEQSALDLAFDGTPRGIDLVKFSTDDSEDHFAVMAGMGLDADLMARTNADLKRAVGPAAYFVAAGMALNTKPFSVTVTVDDAEPVTRDAVLALVGNVGWVHGGIHLLPAAKPDDGLLDVLVASPTSVVDWARVASGLLGGATVEPLEFAQGHHVMIEVTSPVPYQLDGDPGGPTHRIEATIAPRALQILLPADSAARLG